MGNCSFKHTADGKLELTNGDIETITTTYHAWRGDPNSPAEAYVDVPGFCKSATLAEIRGHDHVLTPGRYVGAADAVDDAEPFDDKMKRLTDALQMERTEAARLDAIIVANLREFGYGE